MSKMSKKELKRPDQIWEASRTALHWMTNQWVGIAAFLIVVFIAIVGTIYTNQVRKAKEGSAQSHYAKIEALFDQWKLQPKPEQEKDRLKTEEEMKAELSVLEKEFPRSRANQLAHAIRADLEASQEKWPEAIRYYEQFLNVLPKADRPVGLYPLGIASEQVGDWTKAIKTYDEIIKSKSKTYASLALLGKARSYKAMGKNSDAKKTYEEFLEAYPTSTEISTVRGLLTALSEPAPR